MFCDRKFSWQYSYFLTTADGTEQRHSCSQGGWWWSRTCYYPCAVLGGHHSSERFTLIPFSCPSLFFLPFFHCPSHTIGSVISIDFEQKTVVVKLEDESERTMNAMDVYRQFPHPAGTVKVPTTLPFDLPLSSRPPRHTSVRSAMAVDREKEFHFLVWLQCLLDSNQTLLFQASRSNARSAKGRVIYLQLAHQLTHPTVRAGRQMRSALELLNRRSKPPPLQMRWRWQILAPLLNLSRHSCRHDYAELVNCEFFCFTTLHFEVLLSNRFLQLDAKWVDHPGTGDS